MVYQNEVMIYFEDLKFIAIDQKVAKFKLFEPENIMFMGNRRFRYEKTSMKDLRNFEDLFKTCEGALFKSNFKAAINLCSARFTTPNKFAVILNEQEMLTFKRISL